MGNKNKELKKEFHETFTSGYIERLKNDVAEDIAVKPKITKVSGKRGRPKKIKLELEKIDHEPVTYKIKKPVLIGKVKRTGPDSGLGMELQDDDSSYIKITFNNLEKREMLKADGFKPLSEFLISYEKEELDHKTVPNCIFNLLSDRNPSLSMRKIPISIKGIYVKIIERTKDHDYGDIYLRTVNSNEYRITELRRSVNDAMLYEVSLTRNKDDWSKSRLRNAGVILTGHELSTMIKLMSIEIE